ncbi:hypothetical protein [Oricola sp.]|uniref:hypothetical protein n=1 Tax=Oricola sp. TaxID=1979950 RepID=UPI0025F95FDA|nr:hypothetical protein [Oricola sp.]MCI5076720.1 hypothetical protein [Oricola sp.]
MWDFSVANTLGILGRTMPFILLRMAVYFGITFAYIIAIGAGAGIGYGVGQIGEDPSSFALWGGIGGFGVVSAIVYWIREYILYMVKAGHIAVMVELIDGEPLPQGQIAHAQATVQERFGEANVLFALDQLIKGIIRAITGLLGGVAAFLPIPGLSALVGFFNGVVRMSLTYVDEIILGYNIRMQSQNPWETSRHALVLYAQNGTHMVKNAVWLTLIMWALSLVVFLVALAPASLFVYLVPGPASGYGFVFAFMLAWSVKAAIMEPFAIAALMQVFFARIEGQSPDPEWDRKLAGASGKFRELTEKAREGFGGRPVTH